MKYSRFELLVIAAGTITIAGSIVFSVRAPFEWEEIVGQVLLLGVLVSAVHWGRNGGFAAALIATLAYIAIRIPTVTVDRVLVGDIATLVLIHALTYGLVGIVGGELFSRMKYLYARLESTPGIDEWSHIYNQLFVVKALDNVIGQNARYETPFSIVTIQLSSHLTDELRPVRQRALVRGVAAHIRNDVRLVDEAGRLDDGRFLVILPHTPAAGGRVVVERLHAGVCDTLGARDESVQLTLLAAPENLPEIRALRESLAQGESLSPHVAATSAS